MNERIKKLQRQIQEEEDKMARCAHLWGEPYRDNTTEKVPYGMKLVAQGSDAWPEYEGYRDQTVLRWARKCKKCGKIEHTTKEKPIVSSYKPDFG